METVEERKYRAQPEVTWRATLDEGNLPFNNLKPSLKELSLAEMKKKDAPAQFNFSEDDIFRTFKGKAPPVFNKDKLIYSTKDDKWYKVLDLKTDDNSNPTWVSMSLKNGTETVEISKPEEFDQFKNSLKVFINVNSASGDSTVVEVNPKIYEKFETAFEDAFQGVGASLASYKFFYKSREIQKDECLANIEEIYDGDALFASEGVGKPFKFSRFPEIHDRYQWSNSGRYTDGLAFTPNRNIRISGFSTYAGKTESQYEMKYKVNIGGVDVEEDTVLASGWEEEYYYRHTLNGVYPVTAGQKIEFTVWIAKDLASNQDVTTYRGNRGEEYEKVENEHMGLFKIEHGSSSDNGTSVS